MYKDLQCHPDNEWLAWNGKRALIKTSSGELPFGHCSGPIELDDWRKLSVTFVRVRRTVLWTFWEHGRLVW